MGEGAPPSSDASRRDAQPSPAEPGGRRFKFRNAVLDERSMELRVDGKRVALERKPLEALHYFILHAGEIVTKAELSESLWPGRILTETTVTGCIRKIRSAVGDVDHDLIKTVHGFGYRFADALRVEHCASSAIDALNLSVGDRPPRRPQWELTEKLGVGGHGEAWLARHEKTGDCRVFKFALNKEALAALKREITLYRLLHDSLGQAVAVVRIFEWNLEEEPYYIETEYVEGRDLASWGTSQGKLTDIPLEQRLDLVAQIAQALAAAHSVGVLHKDLKPRNVLVKPGPRPTIKLCDFGSGSVLDGRRLDALGITRLGFTQTLNAGEISGTPLYLAPEIIAGQPFTVRADVYPLGVMLYQCIVGDLKRPLATGWESDIADELLCEDIVLATSGNPDRRTVSAAELAERLYTLELRRAARAEEKAAREKAERARRISQQLRRTQIFTALVMALASAVIWGGVMAHKARNAAIAAADTTKAVSDFLIEDVLRVDPKVERPRAASYESLLKRAAAHVDIRFKGQPSAAADVHWLLGRRFYEIGLFEAATFQYERASVLFSELYGRHSERSLLTLDRLAWMYLELGPWSEGAKLAVEVPMGWTALYGETDLSTLVVRTRMARALIYSGDISEGERELRAVLALIPTAKPPTEASKALIREWLGIANEPTNSALSEIVTAYTKGILAGNAMIEFGSRYAAGVNLLREAETTLIKTLGDDAYLTNITKVGLGYGLTMAGEYQAADVALQRAQQFFDGWLPPKHFYHGVILLGRARLNMEQRRPQEAIKHIQGALDLCAEDLCPPSVQANYLWDRGRALTQLGRYSAAIADFETALPAFERSRGPHHVGSLRIRVDLADALRQNSQIEWAVTTLAPITDQIVSDIGNHETIGDLRRVQGLIALDKDDLPAARKALTQAAQILEEQLPPGHWRIRRANRELHLFRR